MCTYFQTKRTTLTFWAQICPKLPNYVQYFGSNIAEGFAESLVKVEMSWVEVDGAGWRWHINDEKQTKIAFFISRILIWLQNSSNVYTYIRLIYVRWQLARDSWQLKTVNYRCLTGCWRRFCNRKYSKGVVLLLI